MMVKKISIVGAGSVGSTLAFHILSRFCLSDLVLVDTAGDLAQGVALDLEDTRGFLGFATEITGTKNIAAIRSSDIVVITAGISRRPGLSRLDLFKTNADIVSQISRKIKQLAPAAIVIVVTNPLDLITFIATKETGFDSSRIMGMGSTLDTSRLFNIIHGRTGISTTSLEGYVFGEHSKDMLVTPSRLRIKGEPINVFLKDGAFDDIKQRVQMRGAEIVSFLKKGSAYFAPSLACCFLIRAIIGNTNEIIPVSTLLKGESGIKGICMGVPCLINRRGIERIIPLTLTPEEKQAADKIKQLFRESGL